VEGDGAAEAGPSTSNGGGAGTSAGGWGSAAGGGSHPADAFYAAQLSAMKKELKEDFEAALLDKVC
jgi:hypothetical protein